jgi:hypothetical protein
VLRDLAGEAAGEADEAFGVFGEKIFETRGLLVEAVQRGLAGEADEVAVAGFVLGEDEEVVVLGVGVGDSRGGRLLCRCRARSRGWA